MPEVVVRTPRSGSLVEAAADTVARPVDPWVERARARLGSTLRSKWKLDSLLGVGGMAAVYAGTHRNGSRAAVKVLHPELTSHPDARARFLREGYAANAVGHDGAVRVLDDDVSEDGSLFLVTELLDGETLEDRRIRLGGRLPEADVLTAVDQILDVLAAAHSKEVVHRDLKPENIFLTRAGKVKVLDFGIARLRELQPGAQATKSGVTMGTPAFMPPEQALGLWADVDASSDLWAVGATMFALLSGQAIHDGRTANEVLLAAMTRPAPPLSTVVPGISPDVADLVDRALSFDKAGRWSDARTMQMAVQRAYQRRNGSPITTAAPLAVPPTVRVGALPPGPEPVSQTFRSPLSLQRTTASPVVSPSAPPPGSAGAPAFAPPSLPPLPGNSLRPAIVAVVVGGLLALGAVVTGVTLVGFADRHGASSSSSGPPAISAAVAPLPVVPAALTAASAAPGSVPAAAAPAVPPPATPTVAATDLPVAPSAPATSTSNSTSTSRTGARAPSTRSQTPAQTQTPKPATKGNCSPPYVVDPATGKKMWKEECL
jgi:serine/threonine-protein kinase